MTQQEYYELIKKQSAGAEQGEIDTLNKITESQKGVVKEDYGTQIADAETAYNKALDKNEVQRVLNERYIERKAAEMGLTDSGMNRTQQTAIQLSYANQRGDIELQRQKAVDTLAAAMNSKIVELENSRLSSEQQIRSTYDTAATKQATDLYNADIEAENARIKAQNEADEKQRQAQDALMEKLHDDELSDEAKQRYIDVFVSRYPVSTESYDFFKAIGQEKLLYTDWGESDWRSWFSELHDTRGREYAATIYQEFKEKGYLPEKYYKIAGEAAVHG